MESTKLLLLKQDAAVAGAFSAADTVRLLPNFDPYALSSHYHSRYLRSKELEARVYRTSGWVSPTVVVNGQIKGVWEYEEKRSRTRVSVSLFAPLPSHLEQQIEAEAQRLGAFLGGDVDIAIVVS
ncbi:MAG: crosslink repair DNA glycosylase YcaQ family protein [Anaerolineae bacterium]